MSFSTKLKIVGAAFLFSGTVHSAVLEGQTVGYDYNVNATTVATHYPFVGPAPYPSSVLVGAGVEIENIVDNIASLDISDTNLLLDFTNTSQFGGNFAFNGFILSDIHGTIPDFTSITIKANTLVGFDSSRIFFDANTIRINFVGLPFSSDDILSLDVTAVPEPATVTLFSLGLLGFAASRRKTARK